jgi:hypothetical protein
MHGRRLDISDHWLWQDGLPCVNWEQAAEWVDIQFAPPERFEVWTDIARQWLAALAQSLPGEFETLESENFLILAHQDGTLGRGFLNLAEEYRGAILNWLPGVAEFSAPGKQIAMLMCDQVTYYHYISLYYSEGEHGGSSGLHIKGFYPQVVVCNWEHVGIARTLVHELTHQSLEQRDLPQWLEEGLTQLAELDVAGAMPAIVDGRMGRQHKQYWRRYGLEDFWTGEGFAKPGKVQRLCYELSLILMRLLLDHARPRWFGFDRAPRERFYEFLRQAKAADHGETACRAWLGHGLGGLATTFLGPGDWEPRGSRGQ